jgi:hypothetical protein
MKLTEYNIEAFKFIRLEIDNRVQMHYKMVMWKIALGGALIAFLLKEGQSLAVSPFLISAIFLFLMDIVIVENLGHIRSAGVFIKNNVENFEEKDEIIKWEGDFAQAGDSWGCFSIHGYIWGIWIIAPLLVIGGFATDFNPTNKLDLGVLIILLYLAAYSLFLINKELGSNRKININPSKSPIKKHNNTINSDS